MPRKLDLSQFQGDDDDETTVWPKPKSLALTDLKSRTFSHGITKKSKKDLEKEAEDKKIREEEEAQAKLLEDFENSFDGPSAGPSSAYGGRGMGGGFVRAGGVPIAPKLPVPTPAAPPRGPAALGYARPHRAQPRLPSPPPGGAKPRGKRAMDSFLEEIKGNQAAREYRFGHIAKFEGSSVSALAARGHSSGNPHVNEQDGNLPSTVTEDALGRFFAEIGPVGTVKIMWRKGKILKLAEGSAKRHGDGSRVERENDAETAVQELDGAQWGNIKLKVGFSKWVPIPQKALYDLTSGRKRSRSRSLERMRRNSSRSRSPSPSRDRPGRGLSRREEARSPKRRRRSYTGSSGSPYSRSASPRPKSEKDQARERWLATVSEDKTKLIRAVVEKVRDKGRGFEELLMEREKNNPIFTFFFDEKLPDYHLYHSLLSSRHRIPSPPPEDFDDNGYASMYSSDSAEESEIERTDKGKIGRLGKKRLEAMLRAMSGKRVEIARAMEFAVKRAEAADEIAELVCQSLRLDDTPVPRKLARLHLVSDILHNSASPIPNVWKYRLAFEKRLPLVFAHLKGVYDSLHAYTGNISADAFKGQVNAVLEVWERWIVFTQDVQDSLRDYFSGRRKPDQKLEDVAAAQGSVLGGPPKSEAKAMVGFKTSGFKSSFKPIAAEASVPAPVDDVDGEPLDSEALEDVDGQPLDDVDGEPMVLDEDVDGEAMQDDVDGEPM